MTHSYTATAEAVRALATGILAALPTQRPTIDEPPNLTPPQRHDDIDEAAVLAAIDGRHHITTRHDRIHHYPARVEAVRRLKRRGHTDQQIADQMRINVRTVKDIRYRNDIPTTKGAP